MIEICIFKSLFTISYFKLAVSILPKDSKVISVYFRKSKKKKTDSKVNKTNLQFLISLMRLQNHYNAFRFTSQTNCFWYHNFPSSTTSGQLKLLV
jgi:hypothetical protein